jgi:hypothetical protein
MQCKDLEAVLEQEGLSPLPLEAREHLNECVTCQDLLADLSAVVAAAKRLPAEVNPPDRIWVFLRTQLEAEGIIRDQQPLVTPFGAPWWQGFAQLLRPRALATVGAVLFLALGSIYFVERRAPTKTAKIAPAASTQVSETPKITTPPPAQTAPLGPVKKPSQQTLSAGIASRSHPRPHSPNDELKPSPSENAYFGDSAAVLSQTEDALPSHELADNAAVDASLRQNLRTLNEFIAECEARLKKNPQDQLTREYLNMAYQQKAELLTAMMDSGRSEH